MSAATRAAAAISTEGADVDLVERAKAGDRVAFGTLYDRFAPLLLGTAVRLVRDRREADDLVHDVFLEAWQHVREYDERKGTVRTWLLVRLRSRALDRLGRAARWTRALEDEPGGGLAVPSPVDVDAVDAIAVRRALASLENGVREVLEHTYVAGLTAREIADVTGVPLGTVKSRLARGLATLGALFEGSRGRGVEGSRGQTRGAGEDV